MIRYALVCDQHHEFESWFANSAAYDKQVKHRLVTCPLCGSAKIEKALMTPRLARAESPSRQKSDQAMPTETLAPRSADPAATPAAAPVPAPVAMMTPQERALREKLRELRDHIVKNAENVGSKFPEEARKMHYGEIERRSIYGVASAEDAKALHEEGVAFSALPVLPHDRN